MCGLCMCMCMCMCCLWRVLVVEPIEPQGRLAGR